MTNNHFYTVSSACEGSITATEMSKIQPRMDIGGGSALDWFYHELSVKFSYQIKLRDTGSYGFLLPKVTSSPLDRKHSMVY